MLAFPCVASARDIRPQTWTPVTVSLEIRELNGTTKKFPDVPWSLGITVLDTMKMVDGIKFSGDWNRSISDWLITSIDGTINANGSYWTYCVNGEPAGVGAGSYTLGPTAAVVWVYGSAYPPNCK
ncbi:DUF4430 domain-containing protein [Bosea sp. (in: a-proteobacteria)]|uniref:DUF4430 domain-containing protein n=1 Tax=Bosea sp. (in: a-proteobacteria) TaxID=1871050 RepID=UPI003523DA52